jgi:hypothetical protein
MSEESKTGRVGRVGRPFCINPLMKSSKRYLPQNTPLDAPSAPNLISPILDRHSLDHPGVMKIALGQSSTEALKAIGPHFLAIITEADSTAPEHAQGRMILHALPCTKDQLDAAYHVASGSHRAVKMKAPKP